MTESLAFRRGWVASTRLPDHDVAGAWPVARLGPLELRAHPGLALSVAERGGWSVALLGTPVDLDAPSATPAQVAASVVASAANASGERGLVVAVRQVAYLGGRFAALLWDGARLTVLPDCASSVPVYWHRAGEVLTLSSHAHLVGEVTGAEPDLATEALITAAKKNRTSGTVYWPGVTTPFLGVRPLLPNHALSWDGADVRHTRFYPFPDTALTADPDEAYARFRELFLTHVATLCRLGRTGISLTAGLDSRATFAAALPHLGHNALTWSYNNFRVPHAGMQADLLHANRLAVDAGVLHRVVAVEHHAGTPFAAAYERTFRHTRQFAALADAYHHQLPGDVVELQSMVAEVGTGFYKNREGAPTVERLAHLYSRHELGTLPAVREAVEEFVEYADFRPASLGGLDFHDLYYWEGRLGRWGTLRIQEIDLAHPVMLPFNARGIVEALLGPALPDRVHKQALRRLVDDPPPPDPRARPGQPPRSAMASATPSPKAWWPARVRWSRSSR